MFCVVTKILLFSLFSVDGTYMPDQNLLEEYVLNDKGKIWVGSHNSAVGRPWNFAQFDDSVLPCVMLLLESSVKPRSRGNPIVVSRALSKMVHEFSHYKF